MYEAIPEITIDLTTVEAPKRKIRAIWGPSLFDDLYWVHRAWLAGPFRRTVLIPRLKDEKPISHDLHSDQDGV